MKWQLKLIFRSLHLYWYEREVHRHLNPGEFNHPPETADYLVMEVSTNADVKAISSSFEANAGATVGASFLKSPSVAGAPEEETRETQETHQADEIPFQSEKGMLKDKIFTVAEETGSKENEVSCETEEAAEKEERSHEISDATKLKTNKEASILEASSALHTSEDLDTIVETQRNPCLNNEEKCPRLAQPIEKIESENEGIRHYEIEQTSSIVAASPDNQNDKEASLTIIENVEEKLDIPSVTLTRDKSSTPEPGVEAEDKLEENFNIASKVESQDIKMSDENDMTSLLEETEEKSHVEIPSAPQCEEMYLQELGKTEISKAASEICPEDAVRRSQEEECDIQIIERTLEAKSRGAEEVKDEMSPEQKLDILLTKHEEVKQNIDEEQTVSKALAEESGDERGHTSIAGEDVIDAMTAPDQSKNETENEKIQTSLEMVTEKIDRTASKEWSETIIRAKEDASIENQEESFDRKEKEDESVDNEAVRIDGIPKVEDLPPTELHAKTEIAEVENPNKNEDVLNAIHLLEKETLLVEGERLDKVSDFGPQDQIYETNEAAKDEEEHDDNDSQACESTMKPSLELPSEKGTVSTEPSSETSETEIETLSKVHKLDSEENLETTEAKKSMKEDIWEEACESEIQKLSTSDNAEKCHAEEANENIQAATPLKDEIEDDGKAKSIIDEEVTGIGEADDESNISDNVAHLSSEIIIQERDESPQQTEKQVDASKGEDTEAVSEESVKEGTVKNIQDDKNEIDKSSSREIFEESETAEKVDSISDESKQSDENPDSTPECSLVKDQESLQCINPIVEQASLAEEIDKDDECSMGKDQNTENYDRLAKAEEHNEVMLKGEGDSEHILRRNVPEENIEQPPISVTTEADASRQLDDDTVQDRAEEIENEEITNESNFRSLSQVTVAQDPAMDFQNNNKSAEKSDKEIPEECEAEGTGDNIAHEESPSEIIPAPLADKVGSNVSSESCDKDDTAVENQEESFTKKEIEEKSVDIDAVREDTLQNLENFPPRELNVNIEIAEVEISKKNADELNETRPLEQELKEISDFEPQDHVHKENEAAPYEEKHDESDSKACESINNTNLDQPFAEGAVTIEPSPETSEAYIAELEKVQKTNPEEKLKTIEAEMIVKEDVQKKEETCETEIHKLIKSDNCGNCHTEEVTSDKFCSTAFFSETVEQNFQVATLDKGPTSKDELDFNENAKSIISEEVTDEQNKRNNVMHLSSEVFNEETVKSPQQSDMEADIYKGEDIEGQIIGGNNVSDISHENIEHPMDVVSAEIEAGSSSRTDVEEVVESPQLNEREAEIEKDEEVVNENNAKSCSQNPAKDFHDNGINTEQSNIEIFEKSEVTETVDGIVIEAKESHESPNIVREQGNQQNQNLAIVEPSSIGKTDEDASPIKKNEDIQDDSELVKVDEHKVISVETEVGLSSQTNDNTVDEGVGSLKCNDRGAEIAKDEVANESNSKSLSKEAVAQDPVKNFLNDDNSAEKPNAEVCEKSETAEKVDSIVTKAAETDESPDLAKEQEILQIQNLSIIEASLEEKFNEDGISMIKDEDRGNEAQVPEVQKQNEVILMDKEGIEQILQKNESKENIGLPLNVESVETKASASSQIDDTTVEDRGEQPQRKVEDVINEINTESLSHESAAEVPVQNFQNDDINTEKSNTKIFEKSETAEIVASIVTEVIQSDESNNLFEEHESLQSQRATIDEASLAEEIDEDGSSIKKDEGRENSTELKEIEMTEVVFEGEKDLEKTLQKNEYESKENIESLEVISAETEAGATSQPDDTVKEEVEKPQCKETEVEMEKDENIINNSNDKSISQVSVAADPVDNFQIDDNSAENSKPELLMQSSEKCEAARTNEIILDETNQNGEIPCDTMSSSLAKEVDNKQDEESSSVGEQESMQSDKLTSPEASILDEKDESASSPKPDEEDDNNAESEELEVQGENETLKGKEDIQVVRQKFEMEPEVYKGEDTDGQIIEGNNTSGITQESVVEEPVKISQNDENNTKKSSNRKIFEKSDTAETVDCTTTEEKQSAESFNLVKHQESRQNENLTVVETSSTEKIYEDGSSIQKDKELANIEEHNEVILKGEEDLEQTVQKNNTKENIELLLNMVSADTEAGSSSRTDDNIVEEVNGSPQCNVKEAEIEKDAVVNESNTKSRSQDPIKNFNNDDTGAEQSNTEISEKSEIAEAVHAIVTEAEESHESPNVVKEQGIQQHENLAILEASPAEKTEEVRSSIKMDDDREDDSGPAKVDEHDVISTEIEVGVLNQTDDNAVDEGVESPQCNKREVEIAKDEEVTDESHIKSLSQKSVAQDCNENFLNDDNNAEKQNTEVCERSETVDCIVTEAKQTVESPNLAKELEVLQIQNLSITEASSVEKIDEDKNSLKKDENKENETQVAEVEESSEMILEGKEDVEQILQKNEPKVGQPLNVISAETEASASSQTDDNAVEDGGERPLCNETEIQMEKVEDLTNEINIKSLSHEFVAEDPVQNSQNDDIYAEKSNTQTFEKSETAEPDNSIVTEVIQSEETNDLVKEHESLQSEKFTILEAPLEDEIYEDGSSIKKDEDEESNTELAEIEHHEVVLKGEEDLEHTLQKNEFGSNENIELLKVISAEKKTGATSQPDDNTVEEEVEKHQYKEMEEEMEKDEHIIDESNVKSISQVLVAEDPIRNFQNDDNSAEESNTESLEESDEAKTNEKISHEINQSDKIPSETISSSLAKEVESPQDECKIVLEDSVEETSKTVDHTTHEVTENNKSLDSPLQASTTREEESKQSDELTSPEASTVNEKDESGSSPKPDEENENNIESEELRVQSGNETLKAKEDLEEILGKVELGENLEQSITVLSAEIEAGTSSEVDGNPAEEIDESPQYNSKEAGMLKEKDDAEEQITDEQNFNSLSKESVEQEIVKNFQNEETNVEVSNKEIFVSMTSKTGESIALEMNQNNESPNASYPVVLIKEEEISQDKKIDPADIFPDEKKEDDESLFKSSEDDASETKLAEANENSKKEISHGEDNFALELNKKETGELLKSSPDMISAETQTGILIENVDNIIIPKEVATVQNIEEDLEAESQKNEPGELLKSSIDVIKTETKRSMLNDKDNDVANSGDIIGLIAIQNTEETVAIEKKEDRKENIDGSKVEKIPIEKDLKPAAEICDPSKIVENESMEERSMTSEMDVEIIDKTHEVDSEEKLEGIEMSKNKEEGIKKGDIEKVERDNMAASLSEKTAKHIIMEEETTIEISPQSVGEETTLIYGDQVKEKPKMEMHEELELTSINKDSERLVLQEENIEKDQPTEPANETEDDAGEVVREKEMHEIIHAAEDEDIRKQITEKSSIMEETLVFSVTAIDAEGPLEKEKEDENDTVKLKEEIKGFNSEVAEEIAARGNEVPKDTLKAKQQPESVLYPSKASEGGILPLESSEETKGFEQEDKRQLESSDPDTQEKEAITVNTKEMTLSSVDTNATQDNDLNLVEKRDHETPAEADQNEEDIEHQIQNKTFIAGNDKQIEIITGEMPLEKISDDNLIEHSVMSPTVSEVLTSGESKPIDENSANNTTANENTEVTLISSQATEPVYNEYEITTAEAVSKSQFIDTVIENTNEQAGSYQSEDLDRDLDNEQNISKQEYAEVSRTEDTGDLVGQQEFCRSKTSEDNEASNVANEVFKSMDSINADRKEAVLEEEDFAKKSEGSLKEDDAVEKAAIELEALAQNQEVETTEIKSYGYPTDENFESSEPAKKLDCTSEIMTRDLGNEIIQEMDQNKVAENSNSEYLEQNPQEPQESQQETEEKTEPKFEPEDHIEETQHGEETIKAAILTEEVHKEIEKADGGELVNQSNKEENNLKELEPVSIEDQRVDEVTESSCTSDEYLKATDSTEKTESAYSEVQETKTIGKENLNTKEEEEKEVEDAGAATALGFSNIAPKRNSEEVIKEQIVEETDGCYNKEKATIVMEATTDSNLEVQIDDKPVEKSNFPLDDSNSHAVEAEANQQDNMALGENSSNLASQLPTDDHENVQQENVAMNSADVDNMVESKRTSDVEHESKFHDMEELSTGEIRDEYEEAMKMVDKSQGDDTVASSEVGNNQTLPEEIRKEDETASLAMTCKEEEYETKVTTENSEENIVKVITTKDDSPTNSSALEITEERFLQNEKPRELEVCQLELEGKEGIPDSPNEEYEEKGGNLNEFKEESRGASETVSKFKCHDLEAATGTEVTNGQTPTEEQYQKESCASPSKEQELGSATTVEKTEESIKGEEFLEDETKKEEVCLQKEESREHQASELELNSPNEEQKEARATSVEIEDKKDDSESISESNSEGRKEPKEGETCSVQTNPVEKPQEQNQTPFSGTVSKEQEDETLVITESIEEKRQEMESMEETCLQKEEPRELEISLLQLQRDKTVQQERQTELYEREDEGIDGTQEEIKEVSELLPEPSSEEITAVAKYDFTSYHPLPTKISEERSQTSSAGLLSEVQEHGISTTAASIEEKKIGEPRELKSSQVESIDNDAQEKSLEEVHKAEDGIPNEPLKLQPEHENKERDAATTDLMAEENQSKRTTAATEFMHTEVTEEQIKEEKADTKNCHAITVDEAATKESCQEKKLKDEESLGDQELAKDVANEVLSKKMEKTNASGTTEEQISTEKGTVENLHQTFIENDTIKEHFPEEIGEHAEEAGRKLNNENWVNETITGDGKKESVTATEKELGVETSQKEITAILVEAAVSNPGIHQEKKTCDEISEYQKSREAEPERMISTFKKDVPQMLQETMEVTEVSAYAKSADSEAKRHEEEHGAECIVDEKAIEETMSKDSAKISLFDMMQRSTRERQASAELHGEKSKEERQTEETEKAKSDEEVEVETEEHEEEDEHKKNDSGSDAPVMVEASRDIDIKVGHKKSHNILSGVGSKVKHSIIKVKKAITGKSSHPKQQSPK
ncbi:extracellular matrix-binding protein EbhA isoform X1 [Ricinus communis]|uniref:extracellular matrix-binding protein EbhA isoform X1 n=1 Tax=Ricinus communis TaxID=3988 RepID=UPI00201AAEF5|nr:extracellular matrix-binding protein EbhA isoform X1 [Ricinus communis]